MLHYSKLERLATDKQSNLTWPICKLRRKLSVENTAPEEQQSLVTTTKSFNVLAHGVLSCSNGCIKKVGLTNVWLSIRNQSWAVSTKTNQIFYAFLISPVPGTGFEPSTTGITKRVFYLSATETQLLIKSEWYNKHQNGFVTGPATIQDGLSIHLLTLLKRIVFNQTVIHLDGYFMSNQIDFWFNYQWPVL